MHCEGINISGNFCRNELKYLAFLCNQAALDRLKRSCHPMMGKKQVVVLAALKFVGWKYQIVTATLEEKRKEKAKIHYWKEKPLLGL
ncbi:unnamed protein product [Nyctereutes procyonoides]|uniref:(raccoon dog) hypothetical protein n=1 Tax=Nyctereutes procyonoides TaxID=34880 RepID=A0A811Z5H0_NYCPR|nr:unnamed protein product [Nyctereutes procyonoides]